MPVKKGTNPSSIPRSAKGDDFLSQFQYLLVYLKVHRGVKWHKESHTYGSLIPLDEKENLMDLTNKFDWSRVKVRLVMSVPGKYSGEELSHWGMCRLGKVINEEEWLPPVGEKLVGEYQVSAAWRLASKLPRSSTAAAAQAGECRSGRTKL